MLSGSAAVIKYLLFIFNFIFVITGIAILVVGAVIQSEYAQYEDLLNDNYFSTPHLLIAIGVIIFLVAFFGCCGSIRENYCMVLTFASLMILIFILELAAGIAGYMLRNHAESVVQKNMHESMIVYNNNNTVLFSKQEWDQMQTDLMCCGTDGPKDWLAYNVTGFNTSFAYPVSCCATPSHPEACNFTSEFPTGIHQGGCLPKLVTEIQAHAVTLGGAGIGIAVVQLLGVVLSCTLAKGIKQGYETV